MTIPSREKIKQWMGTPGPKTVLTSDEWEWTQPQKIIGPPNSSAMDYTFAISADGTYSVFSSERVGGVGYVDLWSQHRNSRDEPWSTPENLKAPLNTSFEEGGAELSADGLTLLFSSNRPGGFGELDLYIARRESITDAWGDPVNLGEGVNSAATDANPEISIDGRLLLFASRRGGNLNLYQATRTSLDEPFGSVIELEALNSAQNVVHQQFDRHRGHVVQFVRLPELPVHTVDFGQQLAPVGSSWEPGSRVSVTLSGIDDHGDATGLLSYAGGDQKVEFALPDETSVRPAHLKWTLVPYDAHWLDWQPQSKTCLSTTQQGQLECAALQSTDRNLWDDTDRAPTPQ